MKSSQQILSCGQIHGSFPTDRRIDLRQHSCRNLDDIDAPHVNRCQKSRDVSNHAPTEGNQRSATVRARFDESLRQLFEAR